MRQREDIIDELEQELATLDEIYCAGDEEQTYINYLSASKAGNPHLMTYYYIDNPTQLHYEVAMRISQLLELIDLNTDLNFN